METGWASMTQLCTIAVQSSREVTQPRKKWRPAEASLGLLTAAGRVRFFPCSDAGEKTGRSRRGLFTGKWRSRVVWAVGPCVWTVPVRQHSWQHCSLSPAPPTSSPRCLCRSGVPFDCSSGHEWNRLSRFARLRIMNHVRKIGLGMISSAHDVTLRI